MTDDKVEFNDTITFELNQADFFVAMKRYPKDNGEFDDFVHYIKKGMEAQLDWDILYDCTRDAMGSDDEDEEE